MMNSSQRLLVLGHCASRTGAPLLLLEFIKALTHQHHYAVDMLLLEGGTLLGAYRNNARTVRVLEPGGRGIWPAVRRRTLGRLERSVAALRLRYPIWRHPIVYANTIASLDLLRSLAAVGRRTVLHVHELQYATRFYGAEELLKRSESIVDVYIAASNSVRSYLADKCGLDSRKIEVIHEFPIAKADGVMGMEERRRRARERLGVRDEDFVVGMAGTMDWRKGADLFLQVAVGLRARGCDAVRCVWIGGDPRSEQAMHDITRAELAGTVRILPPCSDPEALLAGFDVFALTSREDPFPVVMLEAAELGVPIVAFRDSGGAPEFVESDAGCLVPYLDVEAMCHALAELAKSPEQRQALGRRAKEKVTERFGPERQLARLAGVIKGLQRGRA